jgi:hypothetical protein
MRSLILSYEPCVGSLLEAIHTTLRSGPSLARRLRSSHSYFPPLSTDMLRRVQNRQAGHTNTSSVAKSAILTYLKLLYVFFHCRFFSSVSLSRPH